MGQSSQGGSVNGEGEGEGEVGEEDGTVSAESNSDRVTNSYGSVRPAEEEEVENRGGDSDGVGAFDLQSGLIAETCSVIAASVDLDFRSSEISAGES